MSDLYSELLVKRERTIKDSIIKYGLIVLTVIAVIASLISTPLIWIAAIALGIACYFVIPKTDVEYEYLFVNGEFDIDMVMAKSKRKRVKSFNLSEADLVAPLNSHRMDYYNGNQNMKVLDYSSGNPQHKRFGVITRLDNATCKIILEPDEALAQAMKKTAPSKVFLD
ncbi:DUF6106 family protein [Blautia sp. HCP3S3_C12]|uniref:DUF6106 family protein n=1 Tax=unclassified Blautia TaxID=2648079 RepID=UPI003F88E4B6|nr:DUF6106 family protein [Ruminococcus sp.]